METITQRHNRILETEPLADYLATCAADLKSGDMTISRLRETMSACYLISRLKGYHDRFGKMAKIRESFNMPNAPHRLPQYSLKEFHAYILEAEEFLHDLGIDNYTAKEIAACGELHKPSELFPNGR